MVRVLGSDISNIRNIALLPIGFSSYSDLVETMIMIIYYYLKAISKLTKKQK